MKFSWQRVCAIFLVCLTMGGAASAAVYNARPKLVVVIIIDQFRPDFLERAHDQLAPAGFRLLMERGAWFTGCYYDYANTATTPGHATLFTGAYSDAHGIAANNSWDARAKRMVSSVFDASVRQIGVAGDGASPHNLLSDTIGDELKLATDGKARVFAVSLKDRAAILPGGFAANGAFWIDHASGAWVSSTFYMQQLPGWVQKFNAAGKAEAYWNREWKEAGGALLRKTTRGTPPAFYETVGATPWGNDYELDFARELITQEKLGEGPVTDFLSVSLSAPDILGHKVGPNSEQHKAMVLELDRQLADFFSFLGQRVGLANVWVALSADHGIAPVPAYAHSLRLPAEALNSDKLKADVNAAIAGRLRRPGDYVVGREGGYVFISESAFSAAGISQEAEAERMVGEALLQLGQRSYFTRAQLAAGSVPRDDTGRQLLHSYSNYGGWYVIAIPPPFTLFSDNRTGTTHGSWYRYDQHVPLAFFGLPFQTGVYRGHSEPVDLAVTLASLLGTNPPARAAGRVLTEALRRENTR